MKKPEGIKFLLVLIGIYLIGIVWNLSKLIMQGSGGMSEIYQGLYLIIGLLIGIILIYGFLNAKSWSWWLAVIVLGIKIIQNIFANFLMIPLFLLMFWFIFQKKEWFRSGGITDAHPKVDNIFIWLFVILIVILRIGSGLIENYVSKDLVEYGKNIFIGEIWNSS